MRPPALLSLLLVCTGGAAACAGDHPDIAVRVGLHPGFGRVVFDLGADTGYRMARNGDRLALDFDAERAVQVADGRKPRNVRAIEGGTGHAEITLAPGAGLRIARMDGRLVVDALDPVPRRAPPGAAQPDAIAPPGPGRRSATAAEASALAALPGPQPHPAPPGPEPQTPLQTPPQAPDPRAVTVETLAAPTAARVPPPRPDPAPPANDPPQGGSPAAASPEKSSGQVRLPFDPRSGLAMVRRGDAFLIVSDDRRAFDPASLGPGTLLRDSAVLPLAGGTLIRLRLPAGGGIVPTHDARGWSIAPVDAAPVDAAPLTTVQPGPTPITPVAADHRVLLDCAAPGGVVALSDPETGAPLLVGTLRDGAGAVRAARVMPGLAMPPTLLGVAVEPTSDAVALRPVPGGFVIEGGPDGLPLDSSNPELANLLAAATLTRRLDLPASPPAELLRRLEAEAQAAAAAPARARARPRLMEAQTMLALGMGAEAAGLLRLAAAEDPRAAADPDFNATLAAASLLAGRTEDAAALDDPALGSSDEMTLWRAVASAGRNEADPQAAAAFAATMPLILSYPDRLRARLLPVAAETMALAGQLATAQRLLASRPDDRTLDLARAVSEAASGDRRAALQHLDALAASTDRLVRVRAASRAVELRLEAGSIGPSAAADALARLLFAWRGDARELALRLRVAQLRVQDGAWRPALALLRETGAQFADQAEARALVRARLDEVFAALTRDDGAARLPPFEFAALAEENSDLLVQSQAAAPIAERLADRLLALDLPARAAGLMEKLIAATGDTTARAELGLRLAAARLGVGDAAGAAAALSSTQTPDAPPELVLKRRILMARAAAASGDPDAAEAMLRDDVASGGAASGGADGGGGPAADMLDAARADIAEKAGNWPAEAAALDALAGRRVAGQGVLDDDQQALLLRLAAARARAGDWAGLAALRARAGGRMTAAAAGTLSLLGEAAVTAPSDLPRARAETQLARQVAQSLRPAQPASPPVK